VADGGGGGGGEGIIAVEGFIAVEGIVAVEGSVAVEGIVAVVAATPVVGVSGGDSLLLSSLRLILLARSRLLLLEWCAWAWVAASPAAVKLNQRETSSVLPSVSRTNLAATPSRLQHAHAKYWLWALGK